jgi:hypothetical protein
LVDPSHYISQFTLTFTAMIQRLPPHRLSPDSYSRISPLNLTYKYYYNRELWSLRGKFGSCNATDGLATRKLISVNCPIKREFLRELDFLNLTVVNEVNSADSVTWLTLESWSRGKFFKEMTLRDQV